MPKASRVTACRVSKNPGLSGRVQMSCRYGDIMLRPLALRHVALPTRSLAHQGSGDVNLVTILRIRLG